MKMTCSALVGRIVFRKSVKSLRSSCESSVPRPQLTRVSLSFVLALTHVASMRQRIATDFLELTLFWCAFFDFPRILRFTHFFSIVHAFITHFSGILRIFSCIFFDFVHFSTFVTKMHMNAHTTHTDVHSKKNFAHTHRNT